MPTTYEVNGQLVSEAEYNAFVAENNLPTNPSATAAETLAKYKTAGIIDSTDYNSPTERSQPDNTPFGERLVPGVAPGAEPSPKPETQIQIQDSNGNTVAKDQRVIIRVPNDYLVATTFGGNSNALKNIGGIVFPYTPAISFEVKASYSESTPLHSNFAINFYQRSSVGPITITGRFTVQNETDADIYIATTHLLKALTRMRSGGKQNAAGGRGGPSFNDANSGAPPPVCRLDAFGEMMLNNVPVAITGYRVELPNDIDYFTYQGSIYGKTTLPTVSTIAITCLPMYSRNEMQRFAVTGYLNDNTWYKKQGFI